MFTPFKTAVFSIVAMAFMLIGATSLANTAYAQEAPSTNPSIGFSPKCTNAEKTIMYWQVVNEGSTSGTIQWQNRDNNMSGSFVAEPGTSAMPITVQPGVNNTTDFMWPYGVSTSNSLSDAVCEDTTPVELPVVCTDASLQTNLVYAWDLTTTPGYASISVQTKDGTPVCEDTQLFFTSYSLPPFYNGQPLDYKDGAFVNPTAYPQLRVNTDVIVLKKGEDTSTTLTVMLPHPCIATQLDLYYGPEITEAGINGHGTQNIASEFIPSVGSCATGGNGDGHDCTPQPPVVPETPTTPTVPAVQPVGGSGSMQPVAAPVAPQLPAELPMTGTHSNTVVTALSSLLMGLLTYAMLYRFLPRKNN